MQVTAQPFLITAALLFWGWQTGMLVFAGPMAGLTIASAFSRKRLAFARREFARLWDVTMVLLAGAAIYNRQTLSVSGAVIVFLQWLPLLFFPFTVAVLFSASPCVPRSTFVFWWRTRTAIPERGLNPSYPYFAICLLSASAGSARGLWFYPAAVLLIAAALIVYRPRQRRSVMTLLLFLSVAGAGYFLQSRWRDFQAELEAKTMQWFAGFFPKQFEDQETHTSLGDIGQLKASGRVIMRVRSGDSHNAPSLYRQVSFDRYRGGIWLSTRRQYSPVPERATGTWEFEAANDSSNSVVLLAAVPEGRILLPVPLGCGRARDLPAARLERNRFGNVRVWNCSDPIECTLDFNPESSYEAPPQRNDLEIPFADEAAVSRTVRELGLDSVGPSNAVKKLDEFFTSQFKYAPYAPVESRGVNDASSFVASFLNETRSGHCEYFATAAVLLLRKAGIPARYAVGYAAVEAIDGKREFRIRERHTHSWVLAWIDGRWRDFDPTPQTWNDHELGQSSLLRPFADWWADARFRLGAWKPLPSLNGRLALYLLCPMGGVLVWALLRKRSRLRTSHARASLAQSYAWPGLDSELFLIEELLNKHGAARKNPETIPAWFTRIANQHSSVSQLGPALRLHYKYRFDPLGLTDEERAQLAANVRAWLAERRRAVSAPTRPGATSCRDD